MPIYEYRCNQCGSSFEIMTGLSEAKYPPQCPECSSADTQKKLSKIASSSSGSSGGSSQSWSGGGCATGGRFS